MQLSPQHPPTSHLSIYSSPSNPVPHHHHHHPPHPNPKPTSSHNQSQTALHPTHQPKLSSTKVSPPPQKTPTPTPTRHLHKTAKKKGKKPITHTNKATHSPQGLSASWRWLRLRGRRARLCWGGIAGLSGWGAGALVGCVFVGKRDGGMGGEGTYGLRTFLWV